jgi:hypothetical protein
LFPALHREMLSLEFGQLVFGRFFMCAFSHSIYTTSF